MKTLAFLFPSSFSSSAPLVASTALQAPTPWRILALLAALVLLLHALVLGTLPTDFGPVLEPAAKPVPVMITRSIAQPPPVPTGAPPVVAKPAVQPRPQPDLKKKPAPAQEPPSAPPSEDMPETAETASSSADMFMGVTEGNIQEASSPSTQARPEAPAATDSDTNTTATAATPPASVPAKPPATNPDQTPITAMTLPASVQLDYKMSSSSKWLAYPAKGELVWRNTGSNYDASMTLSALFIGSRSMTSQGQVRPEGLAPSRFSDKSRTEVAAHFEPDKGRVSFSANTPSVPWVQGGQDRLSVFMQLGGMLAGNPAGFAAGASVSIYTVGPRDADTWTFQVEGEEMLSLPFGELATLKLSRQLRHEYDHKLEVWYAPSLGYLPVRNKITQTNGDFVDQQLSAVSHP